MNLDAIDRFRKSDAEKLPPTLRADLLAYGADAIPALIKILEADEDSESWAPIHAVDLLVDLKAAEAIEPLGAAVVEPCLAMLSEPDAVDSFNAATEILAKCGVRDERIFDAICEVLDEDPVLGAVYFADYGDPRGLDLILDEIKYFDPAEHQMTPLVELRQLIFAYADLGGVLPDDVTARVRELEERLAVTGEAQARRSTAKIGRNDPCPCGSGKKYKKCWLA